MTTIEVLGLQIQAHAALGLYFTCPLKKAWPAEASPLWQANSCWRGIKEGSAARAGAIGSNLGICVR